MITPVARDKLRVSAHPRGELTRKLSPFSLCKDSQVDLSGEDAKIDYAVWLLQMLHLVARSNFSSRFFSSPLTDILSSLEIVISIDSW